MSAGFDPLEHTADVGIRSWGDSLGEALEQAGWGLAQVLRMNGPSEGLPVKAATFHQLRVERRADGRVDARVYLDV